MAETRKFPNGGFEVTVLKKQDIINCIDENIIDKDVALAIVNQCELDAANFINEGRWTGLPFIGNVRRPRTKLEINDAAQQLLIEEAKANLSHEQYILFRRQLTAENAKQVKYTRYFNYITSMAITKNKALYNKLVNSKGDNYARIYMFASKHITATNNEYINLEDDDK